MPWCTCFTLGGTFGTAGNTIESFDDSVDTARFSQSADTAYQTFLDAGTGLNAVGFLSAGVYLIMTRSLAQANTAGLTTAQRTTMVNTVLQSGPKEVFGAGNYSLRSRIADGFYAVWASGASSRSTVAPNEVGYRSAGWMLLDLPAFGDNLGGGYGVTTSTTMQSDLITGNVWPSTITGSSTMTILRLGDAVSVASLPWW